MCLLGLENLGSLGPDPANPQKALIVKLPDGWSRATAVFDDENLVSCAGLVPVMGLAEQTGLSELISDKVRLRATMVASCTPTRAIISWSMAGRSAINRVRARSSRYEVRMARHPTWCGGPTVTRG